MRLHSNHLATTQLIASWSRGVLETVFDILSGVCLIYFQVGICVVVVCVAFAHAVASFLGWGGLRLIQWQVSSSNVGL